MHRTRDSIGHTIRKKTKIINRVSRIKGQLDAFSKAIDVDKDCYEVMQLLASCRGALNGLMGEIIEGHVREHIVEADNKKLAAESGEDLIEVLKSFLK